MIQDIGHHILKNSYDPQRRPDDNSLIVMFSDKGMLVKAREEESGSRKILPRLSEFPVKDYKLTFLFGMDDDSLFLMEDGAGEEDIPAGYEFLSVRNIRKLPDVSKKSILEAFTAKQLYTWYKNNRYCGRCGNLTDRSNTERAMVCPSCGNIIYPRVVPAVIVAVLDKENDKILLTKYRGREISYFALVAGFTEIGETLEQTVAREVMEETGLRVKNITYYKSQPWGVADDILAGFYCEVDGDRTIKMDSEELSVADWYSREDVILQPDDLSLTNEMMSNFRNGKV
ncbi:MAG: NAD(+) diphosphatase [Clostridiales bacterium]|nr:NAD(+) diphosphatase [Clostridiales bacterium]